MKKAVIFDMDGVIIDSERIWEKYEEQFLPDLIGKNIYLKIKESILGNSLNVIFKNATKAGATITKDDFLKAYNDQAIGIYKKASITPHIEILMNKLIDLDFRLGLVTSSPFFWINLVLKKLKKNYFDVIISLSDDEKIAPKPSPEGYSKAIKMLGSTPEETIILEDSQRGVSAAKASGAKTICLRQNLSLEDIPAGADVYIDTIQDFINQLEIRK